MKTCVRATLLVSALCCAVAMAGEVPEKVLSLREALSITLQRSPELQVYPDRMQSLLAARQSAGQRPATNLGISVENALGSDQLSGFDSAELTLSLSSVLELGDKRETRAGIVDSRMDRLTSQQRVEELDLLAETARRYIRVLEADALLGLQDESLTLAEDALALVSPLVRAGVAAEFEQNRAGAAVSRARLQRQYAETELKRSHIALAGMWGSQAPDFDVVQGSLFNIGSAGDINAMLLALEDSPDLVLLASESRLIETRLLERQSREHADLQWNIGLRQLRELDDTGLVFGASMPLGSRGRAAPGIAEAEADMAAVEAERQAQLSRLRNQLILTWESLQQSINEVNVIRDEILPQLDSVIEDTRQAYENGNYSYQELVDARQEYLDTEYELITRAADAHELRIELERLAGVSLEPAI